MSKVLGKHSTTSWLIRVMKEKMLGVNHLAEYLGISKGALRYARSQPVEKIAPWIVESIEQIRFGLPKHNLKHAVPWQNPDNGKWFLVSKYRDGMVYEEVAYATLAEAKSEARRREYERQARRAELLQSVSVGSYSGTSAGRLERLQQLKDIERLYVEFLMGQRNMTVFSDPERVAEDITSRLASIQSQIMELQASVPSE